MDPLTDCLKNKPPITSHIPTEPIMSMLDSITGRYYFTVVLTYAPPGPTRTIWHPNMETGPFSVLTRGAFRTATAAHRWASEKGILGSTYSVRRKANPYWTGASPAPHGFV